MMQVIKQTRKQKIKMYMKCTKKQLAEMLIEINRISDAEMEAKNISSNFYVSDQVCDYQRGIKVSENGIQPFCNKCGKSLE